MAYFIYSGGFTEIWQIDLSSPKEVINAIREEQLGEIENDNLVLALSFEEPLSLVEDE